MAIFTNYATLTYNGNTINSNVVTGELREVLTAAKNAVRETYAAGDTVTYVVSIVNSGATAFSGLTVTDDLGAYTVGDATAYPLEYIEGAIRYYINGELQPEPAITAGPPLVIENITVPAGGSAVIVYEAQITDAASPEIGGTIVNEVTIGGDIITPITAEETITAAEEPRLIINKALSPAVVAENGQITYTFTIQNFGNTAVDATDDVVLTDVFDPALDITSVTFNSTVWTEPENYTYDPTTGLFTTVAGQITVPAATYTQNADGTWSTDPGVGTLVVVGTV